ncbi:DUF4935 domain-containing protein [Pseudoflavitalea sp. X16]|uniref:PIN domain-containing protein n=1 Tax=Paraflavitalea devenefica TaxID=2716334 RepID=UPI00141F31A5|nr:PIN domain-containing protein [Paraflavitalea devenefica]NII23552.1 DUF4935 domain-containing protein [Paraflavitalea devenefica]
MYIVLDTCSINNDFNLDSTRINRLSILAKEGDHIIYLPEVVILEMKKHFRDALTEFQKQSGKAINDFNRLTSENHNSPITPESIEKSVRSYGRSLQKKMKALGIKPLATPTGNEDLIAEKAVNRKKPFKVSGEGCPDVLIWVSILRLAEEFAENPSIGAPRILFVTNNYKDFCASENFDLDPELLNDLADFGIEPAVLKVIKNINEVFDMLYTPAITLQSSDIMRYVNSNAFLASDFMEMAKKQFMKYLPYKMFDADQVGFPGIYENPTIDMFYEDFTFEFDPVEVLGAGKIALKINASVTCLFDIYIAKSDYYCMEEFEFNVYDRDWNDYYVAAQQEKNIWFTIELIADEKFGSIQSCDITINEHKNRRPMVRRRTDLFWGVQGGAAI